MQPLADPATEEFGPYVVQERLGLGGMATVYRAKKRGIEGYERNVALKRMLSHLAEDAQFVESFIREAKVASLLVHPNIAQVYDFGRINGTYYIAMELVQGFDLRKLLRHANRTSEPIPLPVILSILVEMCDALDYAHTFVDEHGQALGIVHRDVSPSNLIVAHNGHVKMIDFGIAKAQSRSLRTESGQAKGKLGYMSPEAATGQQIDAGADVFSAGVVAWELITAQPLFSAKSDFETMRRIREVDVVPPSRTNSQCPRALDELVLSATARDPRYRLHSAAMFRQKLDEIANRAGIQVSARSVAEWTSKFTTPSATASGGRELPLLAPEGLTQNIRPSKGSLVRTREDAENATEIWGEDAQTAMSPGPDYSAMAPAPLTAPPSRAFEPAPPPRNRRTAIILFVAIVAVSAGITVAIAWPRGGGTAAPPIASAPRASLKLQIDPADAIVEIGGKEITHSSPFEAALEPGVYTVTVHREGYKPWSSPITLHDEEHQPIVIALDHIALDSPPPIEIAQKPATAHPQPKHDHHPTKGQLATNHEPEPAVAVPDPAPDPTPIAPKPDPVPVPAPPKPDPVPVKPARVPVVPATSVTKLSGELPTLKVHGDDTSGAVNAKMCIDETGRMTGVTILKSPTEIASDLQAALMGWRYKPMATPVCFLLSLRVVVKHAD